MNKTSGSVLIELAIVLPIIVFIALGSVDIAQAIRASKAAATLSREMASIAFRECSIEIAECTTAFSDVGAFKGIADVATAVHNHAKISAIYWSDNDTTTNNCKTGQSISFTSATDAKFPKYAASALKTICTDRLNGQTERRVAVGEAFIPYDPIMPFMSNVVGANGGFYDEMVLF
jgi:Flp pilus assembly protein TadG